MEGSRRATAELKSLARQQRWAAALHVLQQLPGRRVQVTSDQG